MKSYTKVKAWRSKPYLQFILEQIPLIQGQGETVYHHVRINGNAGMGLKPSDSYAVPIPKIIHDLFHDGQESDREFWKRHGIDINAEMQRLINLYVGFIRR